MPTSGEQSITLHRRDDPTKNGDHVYRRPGVRASVYVNKRVFGRGMAAPPTLTLSADDPIFRRSAADLDPADVSAKADRLQQRAARSRERAEEALERARMAEAEAEKASALAGSIQ